MDTLVEVKNNQVVVSSRQVANKFGKLHKDVLESIREIIKAENSALTFYQENTYKAGTGRNYPEYLMNRDGFALLAMGFTGKQALQWKIKYINAFNEMEAKLQDTQQPKQITVNRETKFLTKEYYMAESFAESAVALLDKAKKAQSTKEYVGRMSVVFEQLCRATRFADDAYSAY